MTSNAAMPRFETDTVRRATPAQASMEDHRPKYRHQGAVPDLDHPRDASVMVPNRRQETR